MGITKTFKKLMGGSNKTEMSTAVEQEGTGAEVVLDSSIKEETGKKLNRQVGSKWEHKHDDLDWHSMSRPHPPQTQPQAEKYMSIEAVAPKNNVQSVASSEQPHDDEKPISKRDILCKFVVQQGQRIGETISIDSRNLVFKKGGEKLSIPISSILEITDENVVIGNFERDEALRMGEEWLKRTTNSLKFDDKGMLIND
ncbi:MAG: hypothetical protein P1P80_08855 [ANME-2 cluster archaeon]|nr:hypothetical protein [ANME-2 cluster archaeon]